MIVVILIVANVFVVVVVVFVAFILVNIVVVFDVVAPRILSLKSS